MGSARRGARQGVDEDPDIVTHSARVKQGLAKGVLVADASEQTKAKNQSEEGYTGLVLSPQILKSDGKDIVKKGFSRKKTYLLVFNGWISLARKGKLGVLTDLNTKNPALSIEFPEKKGKVVLMGTIVFPRTKYAVLNFEKKNIVVEEIFDSMVVFTDAKWVGDDGTAVDLRESGAATASLSNEGKGNGDSPSADAERIMADYRCGATTGEPVAIRTKRRNPSEDNFGLALSQSLQNPSQSLQPLGDLEEIEEEDLEMMIQSDEDSDVSFQIGSQSQSNSRKRKSVSLGAAETKLPKRQPSKRKARSTAKKPKEDPIEVLTESEDEGGDDESSMDDGESDWSGGD